MGLSRIENVFMALWYIAVDFDNPFPAMYKKGKKWNQKNTRNVDHIHMENINNNTI